MKNDFSYLLEVYQEALKDKKLYMETTSPYWGKKYKEEETFNNIENLKNFRKNQLLSEGCDDAINSQNKLNLIEWLDYFDSQYLKKNLPQNNIGQSNFAVNFLGYYFDYSLVHPLKWYEKIEKYIKNHSYILEIGGGYGNLARIILNNKNVKYFLIDLPQANLISNYFLQNHFPEKKIFNYLDYKKKNIEEELQNFDIFILPPHVLNNKNISFDFVINARSFMEMEKKTIKFYFNLIQLKIKNDGYFLNINRYLKSVVGENIYFYENPYDDFWDVLISEKSFLQDAVHFLLTIRKKTKGNIQSELAKIKKYKNIHIKHFFNPAIKKFLLFIITKLLLFILGKRILKKISKILYNMTVREI